jgi:hypothetical protein
MQPTIHQRFSPARPSRHRSLLRPPEPPPSTIGTVRTIHRVLRSQAPSAKRFVTCERPWCVCASCRQKRPRNSAPPNVRASFWLSIGDCDRALRRQTRPPKALAQSGGFHRKMFQSNNLHSVAENDATHLTRPRSDRTKNIPCTSQLN